MRNRIKNSLSAKVFLWVFSALTVCCIVIYAIVLTVLPKQYNKDSYNDLEKNLSELCDRIRGKSIDEATQDIYNFCIKNNSTVTLSGDGQSMTFGEQAVSDSEDDDDDNSHTVIMGTAELTVDNTAYEIAVTFLSKTANTISEILIRFLPVIIAVIILISFLSAFICSKVIVTPIARISRISKRMTALDPTWECDVKSSDEIGVLSENLNTMALRLRDTMQELRSANDKLSEDIERSKLLEQQRRDFFIAVSHELKTPLTVLKGQLENMMLGFGDYKDHDKYLPQAYATAEDIENLVKEIISVTKSENVDIGSDLCEILLKESVDETLRAISVIAQEKDVTIHCDISEDRTITADRGMWHKALSNIIGNAVRHSPAGAQVFIASEKDGGKDALVVTNTGAFIPKQDIPHLFTPFYRADRSRNRASGGSGLGLYIVKTILDRYGMSCRLDNTEKGVSFYLYF